MNRGGVAVLAAGNLVGAALGFLIAVLIGRVTGDVGLGAYAAAAAWIFPLSFVAEAGLSAPLTRDAAAYPTQTAGLVRATLLARWRLGGVVCAVVMLLAPWLTATPVSAAALRVGAPLVLLNPLVGTYSAVFRAQGRLKRAAALNIGMLTTQLILTAVALSIGWGVVGAMFANVVSSAAQCVVAWACYRRDSQRDDGTLVAVWGRVWAAWPFAVASVLAAAQMRMGVALTEVWVSAAAAGVYAAAYRFVEAGRLIPQAGFDALLPALSAVREQPAIFAYRAGRVLWLLIGYGVVFAAGCLIIGELVVSLLFGESFSTSGVLLRVMGVALLPMTLKYWAGVVWIARGGERRVTRLNALALVGQLVVSAALIPPYGVVGAALSLVIGEGLGACLMLWRVWGHSG